jgi:hypothetical protein
VHIGVGRKDGASFWPLSREPWISLYFEDGCYWFLHPFIQDLANETGQYIDLYGDAAFEGRNLTALRRMLKAARAAASLQPDSWNVHVGYQTKPVYQEVQRPVEREQLLSLLDAWERIIDRAEQLKRRVVCFGD